MNTLDGWLLQNNKCHRSDCPTDEELLIYPMLDEDVFDRVDERIFRCEKCRKRQENLDEMKDKNSA